MLTPIFARTKPDDTGTRHICTERKHLRQAKKKPDDFSHDMPLWDPCAPLVLLSHKLTPEMRIEENTYNTSVDNESF